MIPDVRQKGITDFTFKEIKLWSMIGQVGARCSSPKDVPT